MKSNIVMEMHFESKEITKLWTFPLQVFPGKKVDTVILANRLLENVFLPWGISGEISSNKVIVSLDKV